MTLHSALWWQWRNIKRLDTKHTPISRLHGELWGVYCEDLGGNWPHYNNIALCYFMMDYSQTSNISCTLVGNKIVDNSDVVGALPVGAAPTTSSFST